MVENKQWSLIRPSSIEEVYGHSLVKNSLMKMIKSKVFPNCIIFQGDSGIGKTTFAKLMAKYFVASSFLEDGSPDPKDPEVIAVDTETYDKSVFRVNGGTEGSVNTFKDNSELGAFLANEWTDKRVVLIEEFQGLSSAAQETLLLSLEEPNTNTLYIFTTTGVTGTKAKKAFDTLASRVSFFNLETPKPGDVMLFLKSFLEKIGKWNDLPGDFRLEGLKYIASLYPNYRRALNELQKCCDAEAFTEDKYKPLVSGSADELSIYPVIKDVLMGRKTAAVAEYVKDFQNDQIQLHARAFKKYLADCEWYKMFKSVPDNNFYQNQNAAEITSGKNTLDFCVANIYKILNYDAQKADMVLFIAGAFNSLSKPTTVTSSTVETPTKTVEPAAPKPRRTLLS